MKLRKKVSASSFHRRSTRRAVNPSREVRKSVSTPVTNIQKSAGAKITNGYSDESDEENDSKQEQDSWIQMKSAVTNTSPGLFGGNSSNLVVTRRRSLRGFSSHHSDLSNPTGSPSPLLHADLQKDKVVEKNFSQVQDDGTPVGVLPSYHKSRREARNGGDILRRQGLNHETQEHVLDNDRSAPSEPQLDTDLNVSSKNTFTTLRKYFNRPTTEQTSGFTQSKKPAPRSWSLQCAYLLPIGTLIFFCTLGLLYVTMRSEDVGPPMLPSSFEVRKWLCTALSPSLLRFITKLIFLKREHKYIIALP